MTEKEIEFIKGKKVYLYNCIEHIIWDIEPNKEAKLLLDIKIMENHIAEIKAILIRNKLLQPTKLPE